ncbi:MULTISPECIES: hydrogen peroxide-inducible genes activator [Dyadobacter]|jgi:LysR family hydrogen peroxide-inducible transcriptional activator|uniref:Hydrogen peroxide-inducible genes activator n=1 Tax=Dyadobacter chenhuakuii TaxID=2909339 RepID=A0ABY4XS02_9BACT|nr:MULTISPECIES: hydrogen peroxide-inducible genes activator [Dyadobacter]MCF2492481.1 hydrogen peroxide-inducible genes activator [Dyadobacter chenhuakuii]MCF2520500.1 hydrogen peroxide-inducible genes activator [Dyadobacter sp. CY351]USJ33219.1 hydrogen peroxide-inducible genes activator [Dyadobacter chenhuakuii]
MNIQQLEYIVAVDNYRHFVQAAEHCNVTQPTLSMMIRKLEEELAVKIFDRTKQPIVPTGIGREIIDQAKTILREASRMNEIAKHFNGDLSGELRIGIIPTIAPYLLPHFVNPFISHYPDIKLHVSEMITERIISELKLGNLDVGIIASLSEESSLQEIPLYKERFYAYVSENTDLYAKKYILPADIEPNELWLLEEGHCFRTQIQRLCELSRNSQFGSSFSYRSGSIETLIRMVEKNGGITILPEMAVMELSDVRKKHIRSFQFPEPAREVCLLVNREQMKTRLIDALKTGITAYLPQEIFETNKEIRIL